jgi:hypothetical protein
MGTRELRALHRRPLATVGCCLDATMIGLGAGMGAAATFAALTAIIASLT